MKNEHLEKKYFLLLRVESFNAFGQNKEHSYFTSPSFRTEMTWSGFLALFYPLTNLSVRKVLWDVNENECQGCSFRICLNIDLQCTLLLYQTSKQDPCFFFCFVFSPLSRSFPLRPHWWVSELLKFQSPDVFQWCPRLVYRLYKVTVRKGRREGWG